MTRTFAVGVGALVFATGAANAVIIMVDPMIASYNFQNPDPRRTATDFRVVLLSVPPPGISGGSFGGAPFPNPVFELPATGGGWLRAIYNGPPGIAPLGTYTHAFPGWPAGTKFEVLFSYPALLGDDFLDPNILDIGTFRTEGVTSRVCPWDLDFDGTVGATDLLALLVQWGGPGPADFDYSGTVGATDLLAMLVNWGPCPWKKALGTRKKGSGYRGISNDSPRPRARASLSQAGHTRPEATRQGLHAAVLGPEHNAFGTSGLPAD